MAPEALYKMGDLFSREKAFDRDIRTAFRLWTRSFQESERRNDPEDKAQAAIRIAPFYLETAKAEEVDISTDTLYALNLYQMAEIGLRLSIQTGLRAYVLRKKITTSDQRPRKSTRHTRRPFLY
ncbi:hypothetical protein [Eggerthella sp. YY7918]|uniref:hypothetical protein n=1 Tax=Eggerthella sp. (strain YY7918) TaxID=502558 RepID=UPI00021716C7|nr:hypothetical protein [Eggerthella sp. YY7918]BAK45558.1 molybdopterin biosynthesis enzyme [Eggerthella sp. YY7918]